MSQTIVIVLLACGQALAQSTGVLKGGFPKVAPKSKFPVPGSHLKQRLPPPSAYAPVYAPQYAPEITTKDLDSSSLPDAYYDARALAPGVKERYAQQAVEDVFAPRAPVFSDTNQDSGGTTGFAPEYAPAYAPAFFGSKKAATASTSAYQGYAATSYTPQEVAARPSAISQPSGGGATGFAPEYAPAYAPSFFGSAMKGATSYQSAPVWSPSNDFTAPQVAHSTYSEPSGGKTGFAPLFAPSYAAAFFGSAKGSSGGASGYAAPSASGYAAPSASYSAPAYAPQVAQSTYSASSGSKVSGFAPLFAPEYAPAFFGSPRDVAAAAHSGAPVSSFSASAYAPPVAARQFASSSSTGSTSKASGFAPLFAPSYSSGFFGKPKVMDLDATQTSSNLLGTLAMALMGISISGIFVAVVRLRRKASTSLEEAYVPAPV